MATPSAIPTNALRDTVARVHRVTRGNRSLWYQMTVLQQPERARACGSGMKANSDRRPVDPPPVVELRIIEGPSVEEGKDITFDYNANFFLYASLEHARPLAHGRVQTPATNNPPILTGVPASGMAYLDRPTEAGYFIFPDLSVRHEGRYRLTFSLFETTKEEKDFDLEPTDGDLPPGVDWRMEIKTLPFSVFSAKKFPGLMESTQLSKTVADQGCRVRIRRDVRMRKRDGKSGGGYDRREEEFSRRRTSTPVAEDPHSLRARSLSNSSEQRVTYPEPQRRPSVVEPYPPPPPPPSYEPSSAGSRHLSFGDSAGPQYPAPRQYAPQPSTPLPPVSASGHYTPTSQSPYPKPEPPSTYGYPSRSLPPACPSPAASMKQDVYDRRPSNAYVPPSPSVYSTDGHSRRDSQPSYPPTPVTAHPTRSLGHKLPPLKISSLISPLPPIEAQTDPFPEPPLISVGGKRKHESVFTQNTMSLHNGQRQLDPHYGNYRRGVTPEPDQGLYSRADGKIGVVTFNQYHS
ncbi:velvet factor-domain-containing protein [Ilyonectria robusta]|uniref:velvet factor-domain-containing protein n=1 Tax=Ilyonectria robusta TaxID=1079257 RepID=UPI001E8E65C5|nr:velvet factor-domain-containing protein [Ilyonectria robusta]KAH8714367.1 velvet factor-domain-containing protein [Ilyonectria robusta]